jgi:hypothetical protein
MSITLDQLLQCEDRLHAEIAQRECLLAAVDVLKGYAEKGNTLRAVELGALGKALLGEAMPGTLLLEETAEKPIEPAPAPVAPALPRPKPYMHPELEALYHGSGLHGRDTLKVSWAVRRMTEDFTLNDIATLLKREGAPMYNAKISVVLTRLKTRGEIQEIRRGGGRTAALFAKPAVPVAPADGAAAETSSTEPPPEANAAEGD